jgi:hypothetical protein
MHLDLIRHKGYALPGAMQEIARMSQNVFSDA